MAVNIFAPKVEEVEVAPKVEVEKVDEGFVAKPFLSATVRFRVGDLVRRSDADLHPHDFDGLMQRKFLSADPT